MTTISAVTEQYSLVFLKTVSLWSLSDNDNMFCFFVFIHICQRACFFFDDANLSRSISARHPLCGHPLFYCYTVSGYVYHLLSVVLLTYAYCVSIPNVIYPFSFRTLGLYVFTPLFDIVSISMRIVSVQILKKITLQLQSLHFAFLAFFCHIWQNMSFSVCVFASLSLSGRILNFESRDLSATFLFLFGRFPFQVFRSSVWCKATCSLMSVLWSTWLDQTILLGYVVCFSFFGFIQSLLPSRIWFLCYVQNTEVLSLGKWMIDSY